MILEYLQPGASAWDAATVVLRAGYYAATLGAAGLALFAIGFAHRLEPELSVRLRHWTLGAAMLGIALSVAALFVRTGVLTAGESLLDGETWDAKMASRIGDAFYIRVIGLGLVAMLATSWRVAPALAAMGALMVAASYAAMGHSTLYRPRQELSALVTLHLLAVAFWVGSLPPLAWAARRGGPAAADLVAAWSRVAIGAVGVVLAAGLVAAWFLVGRWDLLAASWYGWALVAKVLLVLLMLGFAAWHRLRLSPALSAGERGAGERLGRSVWAEAAVALLVFYAAAEMVSVHPIDYGHRVRS